MKKTTGTWHIPTLRSYSTCALFFLGTSLLAATGTKYAEAGSFDNQNSQVVVRTINEEEINAYDAAMKEKDLQIRAEKLYDFLQKFPESPLTRQIPNDVYERISKISEEHTAYYEARQESDPDKRSQKLLNLKKAYPKSSLENHIRNDYFELLNTVFRNRNFSLAETLGDRWLSFYPNDMNAAALVGESALQLGKYQRCGESFEAVYEAKPSATLARGIHDCYQRAKNPSKTIQWAEKLFAFPEFNNDYMLRHDSMMAHYNEGRLAQAAEYAQLTLKSIDVSNPADPVSREQAQKVRRASHHIIASDLMEKEKYSEAISEFEKAIQSEKYAQGYYGIALCFDNKKNVDEAVVYYAVAELMGGPDSAKSKGRLEALYKALHNNTLVGIEKVYSKAQKILDPQKS